MKNSMPLAQIIAFGAFTGLCFSAAFIIGCGPSKSPEPRENVVTKAVEQAKNYLPPSAKNIEFLGNGWYTFEMDDVPLKTTGHRVNTVRYLYRFWYGSHGEIGHTVTRIE